MPTNLALINQGFEEVLEQRLGPPPYWAVIHTKHEPEYEDDDRIDIKRYVEIFPNDKRLEAMALAAQEFVKMFPDPESMLVHEAQNEEAMFCEIDSEFLEPVVMVIVYTPDMSMIGETTIDLDTYIRAD